MATRQTPWQSTCTHTPANHGVPLPEKEYSFWGVDTTPDPNSPRKALGNPCLNQKAARLHAQTHTHTPAEAEVYKAGMVRCHAFALH